MPPKAKHTPKIESHNCSYQRFAIEVKEKTFVNRINYEKTLPLKKRLFPIEQKLTRPRFKPTPYEKPVTRSQRRRSSTLNNADKENQMESPDIEKKSQSSKLNQRSMVRKPAQKVQRDFAPWIQKLSETKKTEVHKPMPISTTVSVPIPPKITTDMNVDNRTTSSICALNYYNVDTAAEAFKLKYFLVS